jgi:hypothetical protein
MAIKIKPSNIFDIGNPSTTSFLADEASMVCQTYECAQGDLSETITVNLYEKVYDNDSGAFGGYRDVRTTANQHFSGTIDAKSDRTNISAYLNINKKVNIEDRAYWSVRRVITYAMKGSNETFEKTVFWDADAGTGAIQESNDNTVRIIDQIIHQEATIPLKVSYTIDGVYANRIEDTQVTDKIGNEVSRGRLDFPQNELVQSTNVFGTRPFVGIDKRVDYPTMFLNEVFSKYSKDRRVISLSLEVGKYYDTLGNLVVDAETADNSMPALIKKYDIIEPYKSSSYGEVPLYKTVDNLPMQFEVIAVNFSYNGISRQEIVAQQIS